MLPAEGVLRAANRWLALLASGDSVNHAWAVFRSSPDLSDVSVTQYASALDWIMSHGLVVQNRLIRSTDGRVAPPSALFAQAIGSIDPSWLVDADILINSADDLPFDAELLAQTFGLTTEAAFAAILTVQRKVDLDARARVGLAGEIALIEFLETRWPGSTVHVAAFDDGAGYDVQFSLPSQCWHLEVKTTTRRGRLTIHLTRNEYRVSRDDSSWVMVLVGLNCGGGLGALATLRRDVLSSRIPQDVSPRGRWESTAIDLAPGDLIRGLGLMCGVEGLLTDSAVSPEFAWLP